MNPLLPSFSRGWCRALLPVLFSAIVAATPAAASYADLILADSPAAYWRLNEAAGATSALDASGADVHGSYTGGVLTGVQGPPVSGEEGRAALFDGSTGSVSTPFAINPASGSFTLEAWVRLDAYNGANTSAILQQDGPLGRTLLKVEGGVREFSSHLGNAARLSGFPVALGEWNHVVLVYDHPAGLLRWYVNGAAHATEAVVPEPETAPLMIARHKSLSGLHFNGALAEIAVYPAALRPEQITARAEFTPEPPPPPDLYPETTLHVNPAHPHASDSNNGSPEDPLASLAEAAARVDPGTTVWVHPGLYTTPVALRRSGTALQPVIFRSVVRDLAEFATDGPAFYPDPEEPAAHVTIEGFRITSATPYGHHPGLRAGNSWTIRECHLFQVFNGIVLDTTYAPADDVAIEATLIEDCDSNGIIARGDKASGQRGPARLRIEDTLLRRCNLGGHAEGSSGGGAHFAGTQGTVLRRVISYDHNGPAFRFTWQDTGLLIEECILFGNHGSEAWVGAGIWIEMSPGPGVIRKNTIFSNTGAGIALLESGGIAVEDNLLVDNDSALVFRDDYDPWVGRASGVTHFLRDLSVTHNRFREWRRAALTTWTDDQMTFRAGSPRWNMVDANAYHAGQAQTLVAWFNGLTLNSLAAMQTELGFESNGSMAAIALPPGFVAFSTVAGLEPQLDDDGTHHSMSAALAGALPDAPVVLPVHAAHLESGDADGWRLQLRDLAENRIIEAHIDDAEVYDRITAALSAFPRWQPLFLRGILAPDTDGTPRLIPVADGKTLLAEAQVEMRGLFREEPQLGPDPATLRLTRKGRIDESMTLPIEIAGTAVADLDYAALPSEITFEPGVTTIDLIIHPLGRDGFSEHPPTLDIQLPPVPGFVSAQDSAHVASVETPARHWLRQNFTIKDLNDPDAPTGLLGDASGDGLTNLAAFAFALDPHLPADASRLPSLQKEDGALHFEFEMRRQPVGIHYTAMVSSDMETWEPLAPDAAEWTLVETGTETDRVSLRISFSPDNQPRFVRLRLSMDE